MSQTLRTATRINADLFKNDPGYGDHVRRQVAHHLIDKMLESGLISIEVEKGPDYWRGEQVMRAEVEIVPPGERDRTLREAISMLQQFPVSLDAAAKLLPKEPKEIRQKAWRDLIFEDDK